jgi:hypothetical protein
MRAALLFVLIVACVHAPRRHIYVPKTPEAAKCWRECKAIAVTCENAPLVIGGIDGVIALSNRGHHCEEERLDCLVTCPGAVEEWRQPPPTPDEPYDWGG